MAPQPDSSKKKRKKNRKTTDMIYDSTFVASWLNSPILWRVGSTHHFCGDIVKLIVMSLIKFRPKLNVYMSSALESEQEPNQPRDQRILRH